MRISRLTMIALAAVATLALAAPASAQISGSLKAAPVSFKADAPTSQAQRNEQGLGVFIQGGWVRVSTYGDNGVPNNLSTAFNGWIVGIGFGGNKSGHFGVGADINYMVRSNSDLGDLKLHYIEVPVYGRVNFTGQSTKEAPTLYVLFGGFVDILLKGQLHGVNVKDQFNGFDVGPVFGVGFEAARVGVEARGNWALRTLASDGNGGFLDLQDSKTFTLIILVKVRLN